MRMEGTAHNERLGDSRGETLSKRNSIILATVPCGNVSVPPPAAKPPPR